MPKFVTRLALFLLGAAALLCAAPAQATDLPPSDLAPVRAAAQPAPKMYRLWHYVGNKRWKQANEPTNRSHKALHGKGKGANRVHVHPKYWNDQINAVAAANGETVAAKNEMLFTVTIDGESPSGTTTDPLPPFCVHYCNNGWIYQRFGSNYQQLYDAEASTKEFRDPSEDCTAPADPVLYFTICGSGQVLGDGTRCCEVRTSPEPMTYTVCVPCPPVVCVPESRKHCLLGGLLRSHRGAFCPRR